MAADRKIRTCQIEPRQWSIVDAQLSDSGLSWIRLGNELAVFGSDDTSLESLTGIQTRSAARVATGTPDAKLAVVSQKGRLFEDEYPNVNVIINKGRFLLIELSTEQFAAIREHKPCFSIQRIEPNSVVFNSPGRPSVREVSPPWVTALVAGVDKTSLGGFAKKLTDFRTRFATSALFLEAARFCQRQLEEFGYQTQLVSVPMGPATSQNLIAERLGNGDRERSQVLVTAHLDSINGGGGPTADAPGADDNASGSAGVLEIARVLKSHASVNNLRFVLFGGEEQGLLGSRQYVRELSAEERGRIKAVINMDMIGNKNTPNRSVLLEGGEVSRAIMEDLEDAAANHTSLEVQTSFNPHNSDHAPFIDNGIPAVLTIEGADGSNTDVHTARDTFDKLDLELAAEILKMNVAFTGVHLGLHV